PDSGLLPHGASLLPVQRASARPSSGPTPHVQTSHLAVGQVVPLSDGRLSFALVGSTAVRIAITSSNGLQTIAKLGPSVEDYAISPEMQRIAWVQQGGRHADSLEVADLGARPFTRTIGPGSHPVWAPDSRGILFLRGTALALWSARAGCIR